MTEMYLVPVLLGILTFTILAFILLYYRSRNVYAPLQDGPKGFQGLFGIHRDPAAGKFHLGVPVLGPDPGNGIEPDEGIPAGLIVLFQAFQQEVPAAFFPYQAHQTDGGGRIRQDFPDHRHRRISLGQGFDFFQKFMHKRGIIAKLEEMHVEEGDTIDVAGISFE